MTLKPHQIGDKGQRYEARATGYPHDGESVIGWASDFEGAADLAEAIRLAPRCKSTAVIDREARIRYEWIGDHWSVTVDLDKLHYRRDDIHGHGPDGFFYGHSCIDEPRLVVMDRYSRADRSVRRSYQIDGLISYETKEEAVAALAVPPMLTNEEAEILAGVSVDWSPTDDRARFYMLIKKGLVELRRNAPHDWQVRRRK